MLYSGSDSGNELSCTPPDLREMAEKAEEGLLPQKSKPRYDKAYNSFKVWCTEKRVENVGSETVLLAYFSEMAKTKKASTLWSTYSMLRTTLMLKKKKDISKFGKLLAFLKRQNVGYKAKKSSTFTTENIQTFLRDGPKDFLALKVGLIIGVSGACRSDELYKMKLEDINFLENKVTIEIPNKKTYQLRAFMVTNEEWIRIIREYTDLRKNIQSEKFFMQIRFGKMMNQPFGHNSIRQVPKKIAAFLKLSNVDTFTGHCFRRTAVTLLVNNGGDLMQLKRLGGWKSGSVAEGYIDSSATNQAKTAKMISNNTSMEISGPNSSSLSFASTSSAQENNFSSKKVQQGLNISISSHNNSNVTINFNK